MSDEIAPRSLTRYIVSGVGIATVLCLFYFYVYFGTSPKIPNEKRPGNTAVASTERDNALESVRENLAKANDLNTCRSAIQQINSSLSQKHEKRPPILSETDRSNLGLLALKPEELKEIEGSTYSLLDAHHLERCFLFNDVAAAIGVGTVGTGKDGKPIRRTALERAAAAFAWVVREVRLVESAAEPVPAEYVVRRGWGTSLERSLVFLGLLQALREDDGGLSGCLLWVRDAPSAPPKLWACGALVDGTKDVFLFDPRLGLPLPGKIGGEVATLADIRQDSKLLKPLNRDAAHSYDVTAEQISGAEVALVFTLSALSPRMRYLQDQILPPMVRANLAEDDPATAVKRWQSALSGTSGTAKVGAWQEGTSLVQRFLPKGEGGLDEEQAYPLNVLRGATTPDDRTLVPMTRLRFFEQNLAPWPAFPAFFRDPRRFPPNISLGRGIRDAFALPFIRSALEPGQARDLLLRGRYAKASENLVDDRDRAIRQESQLRIQGPELASRLDRWVERALRAYAADSRARNQTAEAQAAAKQQLAELWKNGEAVGILLLGVVARQRGAEITYLLGLCKHEEAAILQSQLDLRSRGGFAPSPREAAAARTAWKAAANWYGRHLEEAATGSNAPAARRHRAEALAHLGEKAEAASLLEDLSGPITPLEKVANLYRARELK